MIHGTMTTSSKKDYLSILGLPYEFDDTELKKAFRREARKWHPDLNKNDISAEDRFKLINEAYEFLRDSDKRVKSKNVNKENSQKDNNFKTGFPEYQDYLNCLFGYEYDSNFEKNNWDHKPNNNYQEDEYDDKDSGNLNNDEFQNFDYPATSPEEPPPVKLHEDIETIIELTLSLIHI